MKQHETEKTRTCFQEMIDSNNVCEALSRFCSVRYGCRSRLGNKMLSTWLEVCVNVRYGGEMGSWMDSCVKVADVLSSSCVPAQEPQKEGGYRPSWLNRQSSQGTEVQLESLSLRLSHAELNKRHEESLPWCYPHLNGPYVYVDNFLCKPLFKCI